MEMEVETPKGKSKDWSRQKGRKTDKPKDQLPAKKQAKYGNGGGNTKTEIQRLK